MHECKYTVAWFLSSYHHVHVGYTQCKWKRSDIILVHVGSHNISQGDRKRILGLMWSLIQKYQLRMRGEITHSSHNE